VIIMKNYELQLRLGLRTSMCEEFQADWRSQHNVGAGIENATEVSTAKTIVTIESLQQKYATIRTTESPKSKIMVALLSEFRRKYQNYLGVVAQSAFLLRDNPPVHIFNKVVISIAKDAKNTQSTSIPCPKLLLSRSTFRHFCRQLFQLSCCYSKPTESFYPVFTHKIKSHV
jgi:hypothetical protein